MNIPKAIILALLIHLTLNVALGTEACINLVLSPWVATAQRAKQQEQVRSFLLRQSPSGVRVKLWDGWTGEMLGDALVPALRYDNAAARAQNRDMAGLLTVLAKWMEASQGSESELVGTGALRAPELLPEIAGDSVTGTNAIVLIGSPIYRNLAEPSFSMTDGRYPSDGHLKCTLTESVYGVVQRQGRLNRTAVHWVIPNLAVWQNELHGQAVTRFWALFVQAQGGKLVTVSADLPRVLQRALQAEGVPVLSVHPEPSDEKPTMRSALPRTVPNWLEQVPVPPPIPAVLPVPPPAAPPQAASLPEPQSAPAPTPPPVTVAAAQPLAAPDLPQPAMPFPHGFDSSKTGIGICWSGDGVDLDAYVLPYPGARELSYKRDRTPEGFLYRDERTGNVGRYFEFVEFKTVVDLPRVSVWVNLYAGRGPVSGQVALFNHGQVKVGSFTISAAKGNHGRGDRATSQCWVEIHLSDLPPAIVPLAASKPVNAN